MQELFSSFNMVNNLRNATGGRQFMGRCLIPVKPYTLVPGEEVEEEFDMGLQDWSSIGGPVSPLRTPHTLPEASPFPSAAVP